MLYKGNYIKKGKLVKTRGKRVFRKLQATVNFLGHAKRKDFSAFFILKAFKIFFDSRDFV